MAGEIEAGKLSIPVELDLKTLERQAKTDLKLRAEKIGREAEAAMKGRMRTALGSISGVSSKAGDDSGKAFMRSLKQRVERDQADVKEALARGLLTPAEATKRGREIGKAANDAILAEIQKRADGGTLNDRTFVRLTNGLRSVKEEAKQVGEVGQRSGTLLRSAFLRAGAAIAGLFAVHRVVGYLRESASAATEVARSYLRLASASKLFGVEQSLLNELAARGRTEFHLTTAAANEMAVEVVKLAAAAEQTGRAQELMARALDLGAAQGMDAAAIAHSLQQALRGLDEGTDKLLQKNPSSIYKEYAQSLGRTAASLSDVEQKQALLNAIMEGGERSIGAYDQYIQSNIGSLAVWERSLLSAREEIGGALLPVLVRLTRALEGPLSQAVEGVTGLLERFMTPADRVIAKLQQMGKEAEYALPLILQATIERETKSARKLQRDIEDARVRPGGYVSGQLGSQQELELRSVAKLRRVREAAERAMVDAVQRGDAREADRQRREIDFLTKIIDLDEKRAGALDNVREAQEAVATARERLGWRRELDDIEAALATMAEQADANIVGPTIQALEARRAELMRLLGTVAPDAPPSPTTPPTEAERKRIEAAQRALEQRVREFELMRSHGVPAFDERAKELPALLQQVISLDREIAQIEKEIAATRGQAPEGARELLAAYQAQRDVAAELARSIAQGAEESLGRLDDIRAQVAVVISTVGDMSGAAVDLGEGGWYTLTAAINGVTRATKEAKEANDELLRAQLSGDRDRISAALKQQEAAQKAVARATAQAMKIFEAGTAQGTLTQKQLNDLIERMVELLRAAGVEVKDLQGSGSDWKEIASTVEGLARGVLSVADAMGVLDQETRRALQAVVDIADATTRLFANPGDVGAWAQAIGGVVGLISTAFSGNSEEQRKAHNEQLDATHRLTEALRDLRDAVLLDITVAEKEGLVSAGQGFVERNAWMFDPAYMEAQKTATFGKGLFPHLTQEEYDFLMGLEEATGKEFFDEKEGVLDLKAFWEIWQEFLNMDVGGFADTVIGRMDALDYMFRLGGDAIGDATDRMAMFIEAVRKFSPEFADEFERILNEQGEDAARAWLERQAVLFAQGGTAALGSWARGLTDEEVRRIIDEGFERLDDEDGKGSADSYQVSRSITEVTGNKLLSAFTTGNYWAEVTAHNTAAIATLLGAQGLTDLPTITPPPAPAGGGGDVILNFGPDSLQVDVTLTGAVEDAEAVGGTLGTAFVRRVDEEMGSRFQRARRSSGDNRL